MVFIKKRVSNFLGGNLQNTRKYKDCFSKFTDAFNNIPCTATHLSQTGLLVDLE